MLQLQVVAHPLDVGGDGGDKFLGRIELDHGTQVLDELDGDILTDKVAGEVEDVHLYVGRRSSLKRRRYANRYRCLITHARNGRIRCVNTFTEHTVMGLHLQVGCRETHIGSLATPALHRFAQRIRMTEQTIGFIELAVEQQQADPRSRDRRPIGAHKLATKIGILYDASDVYSSGIHDSFVTEAPGQGLEIVADEQFTADSKTDFTIQLQNIRNAGAELVFLPFYYTEAALVLKQSKDMGFEPVFFGCDGMDGILNLEGFDTSLAEGLMLLTPFAADADDELTKNFVAEYQKRYNEIPIQFGADAYDGMYAFKAAAEKANLNPEMSVEEIGTAMMQAMTEISIDGLTGEGISWDASGSPTKAPKAVVIENGAYKSAE